MATAKRFIITTAVNDTRAHAGFMASIASYCEHTGATLKIVAAKYRNPTAKRSKAKRLKDATYDAAVLPFLTRKEERLGPNLTLFADLPIQPTASNALRGNEVYCAGTSAIIGHVKRQMMVVPTDSRTPRVLWTTGACTVAKYSLSRAGQRAKKHHVLGAVVVKVESNGTFHVRNVSANKDGSFTDLDTIYTPDGAYEAGRALSVVAGDIHSGQDDAESRKGLRKLLDKVRPLHFVLHDVLDMHSRSHHRKSQRDRFDTSKQLVGAEVWGACSDVDDMSGWGPRDMETHIVRSNHDEHLTRWLEEFVAKEDPENDEYFCDLKSRIYRERRRTGKWPNEFELEFRRHYPDNDNVHFLGREDTLNIGNVAHEFHGDDGVNGSRGSIQAYTRLGIKCTIGHSHTPGILDGVFQVGVTGTKRMGYNKRPSTWLHAHVVLGADGKRQLVIVVNGSFGEAA